MDYWFVRVYNLIYCKSLMMSVAEYSMSSLRESTADPDWLHAVAVRYNYA